MADKIFSKTIAVFVLAGVLLVTAWIEESKADWLIYVKPAYEGRVIDAETKEPIEGAVVAVFYEKSTLGLGAGSFSSVIKVKEQLTDENGHFRFSAYITIIQPFSWSSDPAFIIYKPGYASVDSWSMRGCMSGECRPFERKWFFARDKKIQIGDGFVGLPKIDGWDLRTKAQPSPPALLGAKDLPLLYKVINWENRNLAPKEVIIERRSPFEEGFDTYIK